MPTAPPKPCKKTGCPDLTRDGYCDAHMEDRWERDRWRGSPTSRGYGTDWSKSRKKALIRDKFLCVNCLKDGRVTPASEVHHLMKIRRDESRRLDLDNLMSVCSVCHKELEPYA